MLKTTRTTNKRMIGIEKVNSSLQQALKQSAQSVCLVEIINVMTPGNFYDRMIACV